MRLINRGVVIIKARQPFVDWINQVTPDGQPVTLAEVNHECIAILTPDLDNETRTQAYLKRLKPQLFEMELSGWNTEQQTWPEKRTAPMFDTWFELEIHSMVWDAAGTAIIVEEEGIGG